MTNKIKIKSKFTGTHITVEEIGNFLFYHYEGGKIYLRQSKDLLVRATFEPEFGRVTAYAIKNRYQERLGYLGWVDWLSGLDQIHNAEKENFIFADFIRKLEDVEGIITSEVAQRVMECIRNSQTCQE